MGSTLVSAVPAAAVHGGVPGDFNGDGYKDAVLPAPGADVAGKEAAGAVVVLYGSKTGLAASHRKTLTQNSSGVPGTAEKNDMFGYATATADLNRDGYADLVVGSPYEDTTGGTNRGAVTVLWGSGSGLTSGTSLPASAYQGLEPLYFGLDIAATSGSSGAKTEVLVGSWHGSALFTGPFSRTGSYGASAVADYSWAGSVALGDFDGDGAQDHVNVTFGQSGETGGQVVIDPEDDDLSDDLPVYQTEGNGRIPATGDLNGDGYADLVVGDPEDPDTPGVDGALGGRVLVWYGSARGIAKDAPPVQITQNTPSVPGASEEGDSFGAGLAVADLNRDGLADIVVGSPYEDLAEGRAGQVTVIPGRATGALGTGSYSFSQDTAGVPGASEDDDFFGTTVSVGDVNKDGRPELFVGAAGENNYTGAVWVFPGGSSRPVATGSKLFTAASVGLTQQSGTLLGGNGLLWVI
ncbi:FG-GAP-like repeat-containing protein [Streptomyces sp. NBC_00028]